MSLWGGVAIMEETWALRSFMVALIQPKLWEHACEEVKLIVASWLSRIITLTSPLLPYNNVITREILQLIIEALQGLNNIMLSTFQKQRIILELMAEFRFGTFVLNLECNDLIFYVFHKIYTNITIFMYFFKILLA